MKILNLGNLKIG